LGGFHFIVDQALERLDQQMYGLCVDCDEGINVHRLEINPTAIRSIKFAAALSKLVFLKIQFIVSGYILWLASPRCKGYPSHVK
jgi:hypothetical protein